MLGVVLAGVFSGLALGMLGAGGTIIGLPMLLYIGGPQGHVAFGTNAFGVAVIACLLLLWRAARREINFVLGIAFAIPGLFGIAIGVRLGLLFPAGKLVFLLSFLILVVAGWIGYLSTGPGDPAKTRGRPAACVIDKHETNRSHRADCICCGSDFRFLCHRRRISGGARSRAGRGHRPAFIGSLLVDTDRSLCRPRRARICARW